jgi:hypothetical protein
MRHALAAQAELLAGLGARRHAELRPAASTGTSTWSPRVAWVKESGSSQKRSAPCPHEDLVRLT